MKKLFAIALALMLCIGVLSICAAAAPEGVNSMAIVGDGIPGVDSWAPGSATGDMEEVENNIYVKEIVVTEACTMKIKFAGNDDWDNSCNFGSGTLTINGDATELVCDGGSTDMQLEVTEPCVLKFTLDLNAFAEGGAATAKVETVEGAEIPETPETPETPEDPEDPEEPAGDTVRVYAKVPADWTEPHCWAWGAEGNAFAGWPGEPMTLEGDWYVIEIPAWCDSVIVNGNGAQTADLVITAGKDVYIDAIDYVDVIISQDGEPDPRPEKPTEPEATEPAATEPAATEPAGTTDDTADEGGLKSSTVIILVVCGVVVVACIVVAVVVLKPKKD